MWGMMDGQAARSLYSITELAKELGVTARAIRFYEDKGLIAPQRVGNARVYDRRDRGRMILIMRGKRLGFALREIRDWLDLYDADPGQAGQMQVLLNKTRGRLAELERQRDDIEVTLAELREIEAAVFSHLQANNAAKPPNGGLPHGGPSHQQPRRGR